MVVAVSGPMFFVPLVASGPVQPPFAVQAVAFVELHVKVDVPPLAMTLGFAAIVAIGMTFTVTELAALPPGPVQVNV